MDMQNKAKCELSEAFDSSTSPPGTSKHIQDRDQGDTELSHEVHHILAACEDPHDLDLLIRLATSTGGLINDEVRKVACKSLPDVSRPHFPMLTALEGRFCLAAEAMSPSSPALLAHGGISHPIKMKIKSSLM